MDTYTISMKDKQNQMPVIMHRQLCDMSVALFRAETLSSKFPSCVIEVWDSQENLVDTYENRKVW